MNIPGPNIRDEIDDLLAALNQADSKCSTAEEAIATIGWLKIAFRGLATIVIQQQNRIEQLEKNQAKRGADTEPLRGISSTERPAEA